MSSLPFDPVADVAWKHGLINRSCNLQHPKKPSLQNAL
ncbi:Unknown protein sequence [Pseudomonas syringae pv. aceris]|nr:Unknown protein sequence [Pseudomonas syringae pv. aceris]